MDDPDGALGPGGLARPNGRRHDVLVRVAASGAAVAVVIHPQAGGGGRG